MALVSCILATRSYSPYLDAAVESILKQTHQEFELLIMVNGDKKAFEAIREKFTHPKIQVHYSSIRQLAHNLNVGLDMARGEFIARMDDDDISLPERFELQLKYLNDHPETLVVGSNAVFISESGNEVKTTTFRLSSEEISSRLWLYNDLIHPSVMMRKFPIVEVGGYSGLISQDYFLWIRISQVFKNPFAILEKPLLQYRLHPGQERGRLAAYAASASYLVYSFLMYKKISWLLGACVYSVKAFIKPTKKY